MLVLLLFHLICRLLHYLFWILFWVPGVFLSHWIRHRREQRRERKAQLARGSERFQSTQRKPIPMECDVLCSWMLMKSN